MTDFHEILIAGGFLAWFVAGWMIGREFQREKYDSRIIEQARRFDHLSEMIRNDKGKWLLIDYFIGDEGPVEVYECNVCAFEGTDDSDYCPECGSPMYGKEETPEGTRRRIMAESEGVVD